MDASTASMRVHVSSAIVPVPPPSPVVRIDMSLDLGGGVVDLATRVLVAGVVPEPRFGREAEVAATAAALVAAGTDLVDVSLAPRLVGPAVRAVQVPVVVRAETVEAAAAAGRAGAALILVPVALLPDVAVALDGAVSGGAGHAAPSTSTSTSVSGSAPGGRVPALAALVADLPRIADALAAARHADVPLAFDSSRWSGAEAIARETAAAAEGCRILRTADVRRSRRVGEVMSAILAARRDPAATPPRPADEGLR